MPNRLLIISTEFPPGPGGIGVHAYQMADQLSRLGWLVHVVSPQDYVDSAGRLEFNRRLGFGITALETDSQNSLRFVRQFRRIIAVVRRIGPSAMMATGSRALWAAAALTRVTNCPWLAVGHGSEFLFPAGLNRILTNWAAHSADTVVAVSEYTRSLIYRAGIQPRRLAVIPNGADGERFQPDLNTAALRQRLGLGNRRVLLTVGQVTERKAQDVVIRALPAVLPHCPDLLYLIVGLPTRQAELQCLAEQLGVAEHVQFAGAVSNEDLPFYYNLCDLFILVSRRAADGDVEGFGIVILEAAMCGKPAIVSRDSGLLETIRQGETGLAVPSNSPAETAKAILQLLGNEPLRFRMGQQALRLAREATWEKRAAAYHHLLTELIQK